MMRHRSLSGKHGTRPGQDGEPAAKREKKDQKPNSNFALLHSMLGDAATIAEYIREYHSSQKFRDARSVNTFLQAISQRPESVYAELMANYKDEIFTMLERLFAVYALGKQTMIPPAHEFLIRCEQEGVRKAAWGEGVKTLPEKEPAADAEKVSEDTGADAAAAISLASSFSPTALPSAPPPPRAPAPTLPTAEPTLLSPRELLKKLAALDPVGRLQRLIELSSTVDDVNVCARKLATLISEGEGGSAEEKFDFAAKCQLISKLLSKARRVVEPAFVPLPKDTAEETTEEKEGDAEVKAEGDNEVKTTAESTEEGELDGGNPENQPSSSSSPETAAAAAAPVCRRRDPLTEDEVQTFQSALSVALHTLESVLQSRPANIAQQPLSKFTKLLEWCKTQGLLARADERFIAVLEQEVESDIAAQATQLETVISLKSITAGDTVALAQVVDQLWRAGDGKCFVPSSVDVLSAIAVAASANGVEAALKRQIADRLVETQRHLADTVLLPRRALRFVNDERNKVKQAALAKQLEEEEASYKAQHADAQPEDDGEGEDTALEQA